MTMQKVRDLLVALALALAACGTNRGGGAGGGADAGGGVDASIEGCAGVRYDAKGAPAALLVVLDRSSSMAQGGKWSSAAQAITQALDEDVFDSMSLGLLAAPSGTVSGPLCVLGLPVACQAPAAPQIALAPAGAGKSSAASGVRHEIQGWLTTNSPAGGAGGASPLYAAVDVGLSALRAWPEAGKRILLIVTDGTLSCNQLSSPARAGFADCNGCSRDWEDPSNLVALLSQASQDPQRPIETFVVGVPGADTYDAKGCSHPPYHMRAALSAMAAAGSPGHLPAGCTGTAFSQASPDPSVSCHIDLTQGNFSSAQLAGAIAGVRGKVLGCTFELPAPPSGGTIDRGQVNVQVTSGGQAVTVPRRASAGEPCAQTGCWDYDAAGRVELLGRACDDLRAAPGAVQIVTGCATVIL